MLSETEISDIAMQSGAYDEQLSAFARAIETAVLAKLKQQEPVAWRDKHNKFNLYTKKFDQLDAEPLYLHPAPVQAQSEPPVGKVIRNGVIKWAGKYPDVGTELYAAPVRHVGINGLTEAETDASASVMGLTAPVQKEQSK